MKQYAIKINGVFNDIYEWGRGFKGNNTMSTWNWFWRVEFPKKGYTFWKYAEGDKFGGCGHLSSNSGSIYMHPMEFNSVLVASSGLVCISTGNDKKRYYNHFQSELRELKEICDDCAEFCGGTFDFFVSKEFAIETPDLRELIDYKEIGKDEYAEKIGAEVEEGAYKY